MQKHWEKVDRVPGSFWMSELLMNQSLSICCESMIMEVSKQTKSARKAPSREDSILALQAILCSYELLIKRQAMDSRFQTIPSTNRVAALFTRPVLQQSIGAVSLLARLHSKQKVRMVWLLCLLYILQEGPDALIRDELHKMCNPKVREKHTHAE